MSGHKPNDIDPFPLDGGEASTGLPESANLASGRSSAPNKHALYPDDTAAEALARSNRQLKSDLDYMEEHTKIENIREARARRSQKATAEAPDKKVSAETHHHKPTPDTHVIHGGGHEWYIGNDGVTGHDHPMIDCPDGKLASNYDIVNYRALPLMSSEDLERVMDFFEEALDPGMKPN